MRSDDGYWPNGQPKCLLVENMTSDQMATEPGEKVMWPLIFLGPSKTHQTCMKFSGSLSVSYNFPYVCAAITTSPLPLRKKKFDDFWRSLLQLRRWWTFWWPLSLSASGLEWTILLSKWENGERSGWPLKGHLQTWRDICIIDSTKRLFSDTADDCVVRNEN